MTIRAHVTKDAHGTTAAQPPPAKLQRALLRWYDVEKRDLPWRGTKDPYAIWLSEVMLQQTRVDTVRPYYQRFMETYPTVFALAEAPLERVLGDWSGLGYYRRARMLHAGAQQIVRDFGGALPRGVENLRSITGIGPYTAGAVASIAFDERAPLVDGNVARVLSRIFGVEEDVRGGPGRARIWQIAESILPETRAGDFNQALMELGATVCSPTSPRCGPCPVRGMCVAFSSGEPERLPNMAPKAKPRPWKRAALVATLGTDGVLLARRKRDLLFGGLWEPPTLDAGNAASNPDAARLLALAGVKAKVPVRTGEITHVLSHRKMTVEVYRAELRSAHATLEQHAAQDENGHGEYDAIEVVPRTSAMRRGMSTLARKVLRAGGIEVNMGRSEGEATK
ncbi:A/G-specific adenine glycosylase [Pendulispora rubella]|uniref:Adenine DNA glycosylase n=1 Tax=Pendulispora rubella TaxID=2741070 RepID=A0ABZ2LD27_9BACT